MAAAETEPAATRRAVVRSERFVQWQRQLSRARRAPCGSHKRNADAKTSAIQNQQKESDYRIGIKNSRGMWDGREKEEDTNRSGVLEERVQEHQQQSSNCSGAEKASAEPFCENGPFILRESAIFHGQQCQQEHQQGPLQQQQEPAPTRPNTRRGRRALDRNSELHLQTRGEDEDANGLGTKRSTRSHTRTQRTEESPPPPLKLPKLHVVLSRKEVQEDWIKMTGGRYTGKPRKSALSHLGLELCTSMTCASTIHQQYLNDF